MVTPSLIAVAKPVLASIVKTSVSVEIHLTFGLEALSGVTTALNFIEVPIFNLVLGALMVMLVTGTASTSSKLWHSLLAANTKSFIPMPKSLPPTDLAVMIIFTIEAGANVLVKIFGVIPVLNEALSNSFLISSVTSIDSHVLASLDV